jgi:hypothetical protein
VGWIKVGIHNMVKLQLCLSLIMHNAIKALGEVHLVTVLNSVLT